MGTHVGIYTSAGMQKVDTKNPWVGDQLCWGSSLVKEWDSI